MTTLKPQNLKTLDDYAAFYASIPDSKWCVNNFQEGDRCCALGFLKCREDRNSDTCITPAAKRLTRLLGLTDPLELAKANDSQAELSLEDGTRFTPKGKNPRTRVLSLIRKALRKSRV